MNWSVVVILLSVLVVVLIFDVVVVADLVRKALSDGNDLPLRVKPPKARIFITKKQLKIVCRIFCCRCLYVACFITLRAHRAWDATGEIQCMHPMDGMLRKHGRSSSVLAQSVG